MLSFEWRMSSMLVVSSLPWSSSRRELNLRTSVDDSGAPTSSVVISLFFVSSPEVLLEFFIDDPLEDFDF